MTTLLLLALLAAPDPTTPAPPDEAFGTEVKPAAETPQAAKVPTLPARYLTVEARIFSPYGIELLQGGKEVGPGFLGLDLWDAVHGSRDAEDHAKAATVWAGVNLGLGAAALGCLIGSLAAYDAEYGTLQGWPELVPVRGHGVGPTVLSLSFLFSAALSVVARYQVYEEIVLAVDAHNRATLMAP